MTDDKVYDLPSTISKPVECDDAVSREAVLNGLASIAKAKARSDAQKALMGRVMFFTEQLPPVTPKPRTGKWVFLHDKFNEWDGVTWYFKCSECGRKVALLAFKMMTRPTDNEDWERLLETYPYCHCGAKMEGEDI